MQKAVIGISFLQAFEFEVLAGNVSVIIHRRSESGVSETLQDDKLDTVITSRLQSSRSCSGLDILGRV